MPNPTHIIDWESPLSLGGKPVLFCAYQLSCVVEETEEGRDIHPTHITVHTGHDPRLGRPEHEATLPIPSGHSAKQQIIQALNKNAFADAFDLLFAYMLARQVGRDDTLLEEINGRV